MGGCWCDHCQYTAIQFIQTIYTKSYYIWEIILFFCTWDYPVWSCHFSVSSDIISLLHNNRMKREEKNKGFVFFSVLHPYFTVHYLPNWTEANHVYPLHILACAVWACLYQLMQLFIFITIIYFRIGFSCAAMRLWNIFKSWPNNLKGLT